MSSLPIPDIQTKHQQTGFSTVFPNQTSQLVLDFHAVETHRKTSEKQTRGEIFCIFENEWVKFPGKIKKEDVIIPDDNITW